MLFYILTLIYLQVQCILSNYLEIASNFNSPKMERNNIVNKGVWIKNTKDANKNTGNFMFRSNVMDADNIVQSDFNPFSDGNQPNSLYISSYVERNKRSPNTLRIRRYKDSLNSIESLDVNTNDIDNSAFVKSKFISRLKPSTLFNDYPYEIAIILDSKKQARKEAKNYSTYVINDMPKNEHQNLIVSPLTETMTNKSSKIDVLVDNNEVNDTIVPKRSMANYENDVIKKIDYKDYLNNTEGVIPHAKEDKAWQNAPILETNRYKMFPKPDDGKIRPVTERGLLKVLSMLTSTFKKIMKQHSNMKDINKKLNAMNENFLKNIEIISDKFQDFETKYSNLMSMNQKLIDMQEKLNAKEQHFKGKERQLSKNLIEFEIQQKKFLTQQRQFYNIQKLMLAQNERINAKQSAIAKTQSEISRRQNNFARILKKAKQIYVDSKLSVPKTSVTAAFPKFENKPEQNIESPTNDVSKNMEPTRSTTTVKPPLTESVKINLFSVPTANSRLHNQDHLLLSDKDEQPVDDLVYKYYFNNTFIDTLMRNSLSGFASIGERSDKNQNIKNKRDEITEKTTILLPINTAAEEKQSKTVTRERRWINHHSRKKWRHKNKGKAVSETNTVDDQKLVKDTKKPIENLLDAQETKYIPNEGKEINLQKVEPFMAMANKFCNEIGQNTSPQVLNWCIEKSLRRLQNIDIKMPPPPIPNPVVPVKQKLIQSSPVDIQKTTLPSFETLPTIPTTEKVVTIAPAYTPISTMIAETTQNFNMFFPDNDKLELNLKQYDLSPDNEGNVYYDGSLHASDIIKDNANSEGESDLRQDPGSYFQDTIGQDTFDPEDSRGAFLRRMKYERMLNKMSKL